VLGAPSLKSNPLRLPGALSGKEKSGVLNPSLCICASRSLGFGDIFHQNDLSIFQHLGACGIGGKAMIPEILGI